MPIIKRHQFVCLKRNEGVSLARFVAKFNLKRAVFPSVNDRPDFAAF